jgi:cytochrome c-type biogenesis protein CcmH/NrfF
MVLLMKSYFYKFFIIFFLIININNCYSLSTENRIENPDQEARAMALFLEIRCLVCKGQVIENSDTKFAQNVRKLIRDKISLGLSNDEIKLILVKNYGQEILITPSLSNQPWLWLIPIIFLIITLINLVIKNYQNKFK